GGLLDFNYAVLIYLQVKLDQAGYPNWLRVFDGQHEWPPAAVMNEAFAWLRVESMLGKREPRDERYIVDELASAVATAEKQSASGDLLNAWRQYEQIAVTYHEL